MAGAWQMGCAYPCARMLVLSPLPTALTVFSIRDSPGVSPSVCLSPVSRVCSPPPTDLFTSHISTEHLL